MRPSTSTAGFFQEPPSLPNQFYDDASFQRSLKRKPHRHHHFYCILPEGMTK